MKNIHILPTDQPSKLGYISESQTYHLYNNDVFLDELANAINIYITSSEEIKEGDWGVDDENVLTKFCTHFAIHSQTYFNYRKVTLTTDPTLIADGVQSIDDEFLEWFVKNSSCEFINVEKEELKSIYNPNYKDFTTEGNGIYLTPKDTPLQTNETLIEDNIISYKIIIPQEEPKHTQVFSENGNELFFDKEANLIKEEPKHIKNPLSSKNFKVNVNMAVDLFKIKSHDKLYRVTKLFPNVFYGDGKITILEGSILRVSDNRRFSVIYTTDSSSSLYELELKFLSPNIIDRILNKEYESYEYFGVVPVNLNIEEEPEQEKEEEYFKHLEKDKKEFTKEWEDIKQEFGLYEKVMPLDNENIPEEPEEYEEKNQQEILKTEIDWSRFPQETKDKVGYVEPKITFTEEEVLEIIDISCSEGMYIQRTINNVVSIPAIRIKEFQKKVLNNYKKGLKNFQY